MSGYIGSKASVVSSGAERKKVFDITTTTTSLTGCSYTPNQVHVYHNGVRLVDGTDYTATDGSTVTLTTAAQSGDEVVVISYATFQTSDTVSASAGGTFTGDVTFSGGLSGGDTDLTGSNTAPLDLDRTTSDGDHIIIRRDGSKKGAIGAQQGRVIMYDNNAGFFLDGGSSPSIWPWKASATASGQTDAEVSLGEAANRFKDAYLSGGVYLGGTGSANYLDDYEEGTWDPSYTTNGTDFDNVSYNTGVLGGRYTKIGSTVIASGTLYTSSITIGSASGVVAIGNLPFAVAANTSGQNSYASVSIGDASNFAGDTPLSGRTQPSTSIATLFYRTSANAATTNLQPSDLNTGGNKNLLRFTMVYHTT